MQMKVFSRLNEIPEGLADAPVTPGTLVLEGGAWRGLYTQGALDVLMQAGILFKTTVGVSAGAMSGLGYLSGQIGWARHRFHLSFRRADEGIRILDGTPDAAGAGLLCRGD